ncbi:hypothetical protein U9M48_001437 [Paspalum notatum var. saurae]|uniref:Transposase-associated domain-containing protein n=1 Tax=Paspalum notatum var. saurae TaxID=547442 RepID=A0AAQ3PJF9_PASNO
MVACGACLRRLLAAVATTVAPAPAAPGFPWLLWLQSVAAAAPGMHAAIAAAALGRRTRLKLQADGSCPSFPFSQICAGLDLHLPPIHHIQILQPFEMDGDRMAMYDGWRKDGTHSKEWQAVTKAFLDHAFAVEPGLVVLCPCSKCENKWLLAKEDIEEHLCKRGFMPNYLVWRAHGERGGRVDQGVDLHEDHDRMDEMLNDLGMGVDRTSERQGQLPPEVKEFHRLLDASDERLHDYTQSTLLQTLTRLMSIKSKHNISNTAYNDFVKLIDDILPKNHKLPKNLYFAKKILAGLGMKYEKIDVCPNNCIMFWEKDGTDKLDCCNQCNASRYVQVTNDKGESVTTKVAAKQLRYMPLDSRFLRMYLCKKTTMHMRWPTEGKHQNKNEDIMEHPVDGDAWKALDNFDPEFAKDPRSIQFGLSMDSFTPFNTNASPYCCWPVFIIPYNLPPELVNKDEYMFLALVIPGPEHPGPKLNMFMRPLFKDLKRLWRGVKAYDSYAKEEFTLCAAYLWSVHDFMAYGDWSGVCMVGFAVQYAWMIQMHSN